MWLSLSLSLALAEDSAEAAREIPGTSIVLEAQDGGPDRLLIKDPDGSVRPIDGLTGEIEWLGALEHQPRSRSDSDPPTYFGFTLDGRHGVIDREAALVVAPQYDGVRPTPTTTGKDVSFAVWTVERDGKLGLWQKDEEILPPVWNEVQYWAYAKSAAVKGDEGWGIVRDLWNGELALEPVHDEIRFEHGLYGVRKGELWAVYNPKPRRVVTEFVFPSVVGVVKDRKGLVCMVVVDAEDKKRCVHVDGEVKRHKD